MQLTFVKRLFFRFSSPCHLNVITTNINIYFIYQLIKIGVKMVNIKPVFTFARVSNQKRAKIVSDIVIFL